MTGREIIRSGRFCSTLQEAGGYDTSLTGSVRGPDAENILAPKVLPVDSAYLKRRGNPA